MLSNRDIAKRIKKLKKKAPRVKERCIEARQIIEEMEQQKIVRKENITPIRTITYMP